MSHVVLYFCDMTDQESKVWKKFWNNVLRGDYNSLSVAESSIINRIHRRRVIASFGHDGIGFINALYLDGVLLSSGFTRLVIGNHGPYIEMDSIALPLAVKPGHEWRIGSSRVKYEWYIPRESREVKIYKQINTVGYADYCVGMFYACPYELFNLTPVDREVDIIPNYELLV